jgi:hypothetical protein
MNNEKSIQSNEFNSIGRTSHYIYVKGGGSNPGHPISPSYGWNL